MKRRPNGLIVGVLTLSVLLLVLLVMTARPHTNTPLDPDNPSPHGAQAVARVLEQHGVAVDRAGNLDELRRGNTGDETTVLLTDEFLIPHDERQDFLASARTAGTLVVVDPSDSLRESLFDQEADESENGPVYAASAGDGKKIVALNDPTLLTNASVDDGDNARQALTSLGERRRMVWISTWNGATGEQTGLDWPAWKTPLTWAIGLSVLFLVVLRGRRFGLLALEPMPVTVKAVESTRALASLYRRSSARDSAASALRDGTASRVGAGLGLSQGRRSPDLVADALRARGGTTTEGDDDAKTPNVPHDLAERLTGPPPENDKALVELARELDRLEKEILR